MIKHILILLCFLAFAAATAQTNVYHPFPLVDGATWKVKWQDVGCITPGNPQTYQYHVKYQYILLGDTAINSIPYKKLYMGPIIPFPYYGCSPSLAFVINGGYVGGLRQDTSLRTVYFYPENATQEYLLYDFTMQVGDTIDGYMSYPGGADTYTVTGFDSVLVGSQYHRTTVLNSGVHIEGLGSSAGLLESPRYFEGQSWLECYVIPGVTTPANDSLCNLLELTSVAENTHSIQATIYPNPATNSFTIHLPQASKFNVQLFNLTGQQVGSYQVISNQLVIERNNLPAGLYFVRIDAGTSSTTKKIIFE